jgi:hypothetical protein
MSTRVPYEVQYPSISTSSHPNYYLLLLFLIANYSNKIIKYTVGCEGAARKRIILNSYRNKNS